MAFTIRDVETNHEFQKQNLVTIPSRRGGYDLHKCTKCGIEAKVIQLSTYTFVGRISAKNARNCQFALPKEQPSKIKITYCYAMGAQFKNLTPDSIHEVIEPPKGENNNRGVWVMGVGEPVKVLSDEFKEVND